MPLTSAPHGGLCRILSIDRANSALIRQALGLKPGVVVKVICQHPSPFNPRLVEVEFGDETVSLPGIVARGIDVSLLTVEGAAK